MASVVTFINDLSPQRFMIKRAQGRKKFGMKNFKTRFFRLTINSLTYSKTEGWCRFELLCLYVRVTNHCKYKTV